MGPAPRGSGSICFPPAHLVRVVVLIVVVVAVAVLVRRGYEIGEAISVVAASVLLSEEVGRLLTSPQRQPSA